MIDTQTRAAIGDLNARFAWALDLKDWDALRATLMPDVHYVSVGREFSDADSVIASFRHRVGPRTTRHGLGNLLLDLAPDRTITGRGSWHTFASTTDEVSGVPLFMVADFHDSYTLDRSGAWRIAARAIVPVFRDETLAPILATGAGT